MTIAASNSPWTSGAMTMSGTPGNAIRAGAAGSKFTTVTSLPSARSANAIASWLPIESPSGRECEEMTNRCRARMASAICRISGSVAAIAARRRVWFGGRVWIGGVRLQANLVAFTFVQLVDDLIDAIGAGGRVVVLKPELGHALEPQPGANLAAQERRRALEGPGAVRARLLVPEHGVEDAREVDVGADRDAGERDEPDAGIVDLPDEHQRQLAADLIGHSVGPRAL